MTSSVDELMPLLIPTFSRYDARFAYWLRIHTLLFISLFITFIFIRDEIADSWYLSRQHLQKLKKKDGATGTPDPSTPKKGGSSAVANKATPTPKKPKGTPRSAKRKQALAVASDNEDEDEEDKPPKKLKFE